MRFAYVCADPGVPVFGSKGCSIHVQEIVRAMLNRGAEVDLYVARTDGDRPSELAPCRVYELPLTKCADVRSREVEQVRWNQRVVHALNRGGGYDLVYERHSIWSANAMSWARSRDVQSVLEVNAPLIEEQSSHRQLVQSHLARVLTRRAMRNAAVVYTVSNAIEPYCRQFLPVDRKIHVISNGVNTDRFSPAIEPADRFRGLTVGFVGSLKPWHGIDTLIVAFAELRDRLASRNSCKPVDCRLLLVGNGPQFKSIESQLAQRNELRDSVQLLGAVPPRAVPALVNTFDIATAPYPDLGDFYFSPLKIFEYMAAGRAVVASDTGQISKVINHGECGWLYPPGDVKRLADSLIHLAQERSLRIKLGKQARQTALQHTWIRVLDQILAVSRDSSVSSNDKQGLEDEIQV